MTRLLIFDKNFFPKSWASKLGVRLICECGLYAGVYGICPDKILLARSKLRNNIKIHSKT